MEYEHEGGWMAQNKYFCPPNKKYILLRRVAPVRIGKYDTEWKQIGNSYGETIKIWNNKRIINDIPLMVFILNTYLYTDNVSDIRELDNKVEKDGGF